MYHPQILFVPAELGYASFQYLDALITFQALHDPLGSEVISLPDVQALLFYLRRSEQL